MYVLYELFTELISGFCFLRFLGFTGFYRVFFYKDDKSLRVLNRVDYIGLT